MFCSECGAKLTKKATFCGECGAPVTQVEETQEKEETVPVTPKKPKSKPMSKGKKIALVFVALVIVGGIFAFKTLSEKFGPEGVSKEYIEALKRQDSDKIYSYLELEGDTTFVTKEAFKKIFELTNDSQNKINNYKFLKTTYGDENLSATVSYKITRKNTSGEDDIEIRLVKNSDKKYFIFDSWSVAMNVSSYISKDYTVSVPKGAKATVAGVELGEKYKDNKNTTSSLDVYVIPQIFQTETEIKTVLANGITITSNVTPSSYQNSYVASLNLNNIDTKTQATLRDRIKKDITGIYGNIIAKKDWSKIKNNYQYEKADLTNLQKFYTNLYSSVTDSSYRTLKKFNVTDVVLNSASLDLNGRLKLSVRISYSYTIDYRYYSDAKPETRSSSSYFMTDVTYDYVNNEYKLNNVSSGVSYFSGY